MKKVLFSGKDVEVRFNGNIQNKKNIIIFREGGGLPVILKDGTKILDQFFNIINFEGFFASEEINEFYIDAFHCHLYATDEMEKAIQSIKEIIYPDAKNITFGLSMGATGAVNFSKDLNATFLAFAPRATASGLLALHHKAKIYADSHKLPPSKIEQGICKDCHGYIFFDYYHNIDKIHALYIKKHTKAEIFNHPFWGHVNLLKVCQLMTLKNIINNIFDQKFTLKTLKNKMHNNYLKDSHYKYINFIIDKYYQKKIQKPLKYFLADRIDMKNIQHIQYVTNYLLKINKYEIAFYFANEAYILNKNNSNTKQIIFECLTKLPSNLPCGEFAFLNKEISAYKSYREMNIRKALNIFNNIQDDIFFSPLAYIAYARCLEFLKKEQEAFEVIKKGISYYPNNKDIQLYKNCLELSLSLTPANQEDILGAFLFIAGRIYKIIKGNYSGIYVYYSLFNCETKKYLRHYNGKIIESKNELTDIFYFDSSFIIYMINTKKVALRCSNLNLMNLFISKFGDNICKIHTFENIKYIDYFTFDIYYQK